MNNQGDTLEPLVVWNMEVCISEVSGILPLCEIMRTRAAECYKATFQSCMLSQLGEKG